MLEGHQFKYCTHKNRVENEPILGTQVSYNTAAQ